MSSGPAFVLRNVSKSFGSFQALCGVALEIDAGEQVALIGPSGAGKSTLLSLLNGTQAPSRGQVLVMGHDLTALSARERRRILRRVGTVHQGSMLVDELLVIHNVNAGHLGRWPLGKALLSLIWPLERMAAREALEQVGIPEKLYARTGQLSGGEQQRVALARVLLQQPQAVLADEPISHLDPERGREIMDLLRDLCALTGKTLVTSFHSIGFVKTHFQRAIGMRAGRILFDRPTAELDRHWISELYRIERPQQAESGPAPAQTFPAGPEDAWTLAAGE